MRLPIKLVLIVLVLTASAAGAPQQGSIEGTLAPRGAAAEIAAQKGGVSVAVVQAKGEAGKFRIPLAPGTYTILVSAPVSSFPIRLDNIVVRPGVATVLPELLIVPGSGKAVLSGRVIPPLPGSEIRLIQEGRERAAARTDREGRYEFRELPAGEYELRATAPGHAEDIAPVTVPENQRVRQTAVLFPVSAVDGVDWAAGKIRATGVGSPPQNAANAAQARAMTERAAMAAAQRNLLRIVRQITIGNGRTVGNFMETLSGAERIEGFLKGYRVVSERELPDGSIETVLELPLTGPAGLSRYLGE
jgi:hypothetical protein